VSKMISERDIRNFEAREQDWLEDQGDFDVFWEKKLDDESMFFDWLQERFERSVNIFSDLSGLKPAFYGKMIDMLTEAAMTGFFFGELRWQGDVDAMMEQVLLDFPSTIPYSGDLQLTGEN